MMPQHVLARARERLTTIDATAPVTEAADRMAKPHVDLVVVCDSDGRMVGVVTKTNIVGQVRQCLGGACTTSVADIMVRDVVSCGPDGSLQDVWSAMKGTGLQRVPVVDGHGRPVGIIYARDALQHLLREVEDEEALLRDYVLGIGYR
ncbi:CBS domain-containing protein [Geminicoccus harenae]|uniref:CBS domain-containing protein n=1 Tax=Geminicoccus harenae TaxID=2498453 RepID=UPI00168AD25B|nr:CBS domain-containing protein [Geminicoccus harenae]